MPSPPRASRRWWTQFENGKEFVPLNESELYGKYMTTSWATRASGGANYLGWLRALAVQVGRCGQERAGRVPAGLISKLFDSNPLNNFITVTREGCSATAAGKGG